MPWYGLVWHGTWNRSKYDYLKGARDCHNVLFPPIKKEPNFVRRNQWLKQYIPSQRRWPLPFDSIPPSSYLRPEVVCSADLWPDELPSFSTLRFSQPVVPVRSRPHGLELVPHSPRKHPAQPGEKVRPDQRLAILYLRPISSHFVPFSHGYGEASGEYTIYTIPDRLLEWKWKGVTLLTEQRTKVVPPGFYTITAAVLAGVFRLFDLPGARIRF